MKTCPLFPITAFALLLTLSAATTLSAAAPSRPNILYFYVDDMGWGSIGPNAQAERKANKLPSVLTPNLDKLAAEGINFSRGYGCHVCSPARSSQQSGFHQGHTFADRNDPDNAKKAMRADEILMGDALSAAGYTTGYWGKWGYGGSLDMQNPTIDNIQTLPTSHGYQHVLAELHHVRAHTFFQPTLWSAPAPKDALGSIHLIPNSLADYQNNPDYTNTPALQDHADYPDTAYCDDLYAFKALDFVRTFGQQYNKTGKPFFGLLAAQIPHGPFNEVARLPDWNKAYADDPHFASLADQTRQWAAMVTRIDAHFGNILAALEDPNNDGDTSDSIADNTVVIFQSDNGGPGGKNNVELDANGGLRGNKGHIQEGGIRVPLVMRWPAMINKNSPLKAGTSTTMIVDVTDLLPTFCELAGTPAPLGIDGVSIAPTLRGQGHQRHREFIIHEAGNGQSIIRDNYKLVRSGAAKPSKKKSKSKKSDAPPESNFALYDLTKDHAEKNNIAADHPELVEELKTLLLGERVTEDKGFTNTYHHWTGKDDANTSNPDHWSDYEYANAGITYITDNGAPQLSWTARIENTTNKPNTALADEDLEFLGLEVRGKSKNAPQTLSLDSKVNLTGRNEIRLAAHATLTVNDGSVSSLRWIDILPGATLDGTGTVDAIVYNDGSLAPAPNLELNRDYHETEDANLTVELSGTKKPALKIDGDAALAGTLSLTLADGFKPAPGKAAKVLTAETISGTFANPNNEVTTPDGTRFSIDYSGNAVSLTAKP